MINNGCLQVFGFNMPKNTRKATNCVKLKIYIYIYIYIGSDTPELPLVLLALNVGLNQGLLFNLLNKGICSKPLTTVHVHHHQIGSTPGILSTFDRRYITVQT